MINEPSTLERTVDVFVTSARKDIQGLQYVGEMVEKAPAVAARFNFNDDPVREQPDALCVTVRLVSDGDEFGLRE